MNKILVTNTLTGKKEEFVPKQASQVQIYSCGPTVYGYAHVGNARSALTADLVVRSLRSAGYKVVFARNITDIDDRIIKAAADNGVEWTEIVSKFTATYRNELNALNIVKPDFEPTATGSLNEIIQMTEKLINLGFAYASDTPFGTDVYFRVNKFKDYGKLSKRKTEDLISGARIEPGESKENPLDFALWKAAKPGEPTFESPWGMGRPGWHIECSAMIHTLFPNGIDIHLGGNDLVFPHHENEIAQSESCTSKPLATYWVHNGMLNLGREKMSKSVGNIISTDKFLQSYGPEVFRLMCLQHHYHAPMDFSEESILRSEALLERLYHAKDKYLQAKLYFSKISAQELKSKIDAYLSQLGAEFKNIEFSLFAGLYDDFNSAKGLGLLLKTVRALNKLGDEKAWIIFGDFENFVSNILVLLNKDPKTELQEMRSRKLKRLGVDIEQAKEIDDLLSKRELARKSKNFDESDRIRDELEKKSVIVMDGPDGASWSMKQ